METQRMIASFITTELSTSGSDFIVAIALVRPSDPVEIDNLILMRAPKYEMLLPANERGVYVSHDGNSIEEKGILTHVSFDSVSLEVRTNSHRYSVDLSKIDEEELELMLRGIRKMNVDGSFQATGV